MLYKIAQDFPNDMILEEGGPLVSLFQPTHRHFPENQQDTIVFKNLLREIENSLKRTYKNDIIESIMKPFHQIERDVPFWNHTLESIAVFASQNKCIVYNLFNTVKEFSVVADSFHLMPLIQEVQSLEKYQLLGLSGNNFAIFQGNRHGFSEILIGSDTPRTLEDVLGKQLTEPYLTQGSYGGVGGPTMYHGHGDVKKEIDKDTEKYFRYVDRFIIENYSEKSKLPLILVSLIENHSLFKRISHNPYLLEEGINISYESLKIEELKKKALIIIEPIIWEKIKKLVESYKIASEKSMGASELSQVVKAAFESRVERMMFEKDRIIPGKIDKKTGEIKLGDINDPDCDDILNDLAELVLKNRGDIIILPKDKIPSTTGVAAIYRYN